MVARVLGKLLNTVGILPTDKVTEVQRTDLVGEFVGHTGPKTRRKVTNTDQNILNFTYGFCSMNLKSFNLWTDPRSRGRNSVCG